MSPERRPHQPITIDEVASHACENTLENNGHVPTLVLQGDKGLMVAAIDLMLPTAELRQQAMFTAGQEIAKKATFGILSQVFFIGEAWMSLAKEQPDQPVRPAEDPARQEVLLIASLEMNQLKSKIVLFEMLRDESDNLLELLPFDPPGAEEEKLENPLLEAFASGYLAQVGGRFN